MGTFQDDAAAATRARREQPCTRTEPQGRWWKEFSLGGLKEVPFPPNTLLSSSSPALPLPPPPPLHLDVFSSFLSSAPLPAGNTQRAASKRKTARRARRHARRLAEREGSFVPVSSFSEYLRLPKTMLPLVAVMGMLFGSMPDASLFSCVSQLGFRDLSTAVFDADAQYVCGLGLGFIPTPHLSLSRFYAQVMSDTRAFTRRVIILDYFHSHTDEFAAPDECPAAFRIRNPGWMPPQAHNPSANVLEYCMAVTESVATRLKTQQKQIKSNLCYRQRARLEALCELETQVFAVADKNLGLTAMDTADYKAACLRWLGRTHTKILLSADFVISRTLSLLRET